jgi:hypothetical protein
MSAFLPRDRTDAAVALAIETADFCSGTPGLSATSDKSTRSIHQTVGRI